MIGIVGSGQFFVSPILIRRQDEVELNFEIRVKYTNMCERGSWVFRRRIHVARHLLDNLTTTLPLSTLLPSPFYTVALRDDTRLRRPVAFSFSLFLYFSLYRQIRATVRIYYPRNEQYTHHAIRQAGNCIVLSRITNISLHLLKFLYQFFVTHASFGRLPRTWPSFSNLGSNFTIDFLPR